MSPSTPLPWNEVAESRLWRNVDTQDERFILHACNSYPELQRKALGYEKLVKLLEEIRISETAFAEDAEELLRELGELE